MATPVLARSSQFIWRWQQIVIVFCLLSAEHYSVALAARNIDKVEFDFDNFRELQEKL